MGQRLPGTDSEGGGLERDRDDFGVARLRAARAKGCQFTTFSGRRFERVVICYVLLCVHNIIYYMLYNFTRILLGCLGITWIPLRNHRDPQVLLLAGKVVNWSQPADLER